MGNINVACIDESEDSATRTRPVQKVAITDLAYATIGLSQVVPKLTKLAETRQTEAEIQAAHVRKIADTVRDMTSTLEQTVKQLKLSTNEIGDLTAFIKRIADTTRMIAINAGIAAAHAGEKGREFSVLAGEIRSLSENTSTATKDVQNKIERLQENTTRTASVVGINETVGNIKIEADNLETGLGWLLERMNEADASASRQASEARELNALGIDLRDLSEQMIRSVGSFRLDVHDQAELLLQELRTLPGLCSGDSRLIAETLRQVVNRFMYVELAYATDTRGVQVTENISRNEFRAAYGNTGLRKDWSQRPWYIGALNTDGVYLSEIYRSQATDEFCLTASATYFDENDRFMGVVALDINFREILGVN